MVYGVVLPHLAFTKLMIHIDENLINHENNLGSLFSDEARLVPHVNNGR